MSETTEQKAQAAIEQSVNESDLRDRVYQITLSALSHGKLDTDHIRKVINDVGTGVLTGLKSQRQQIDVSLQHAVAGIDDAVGKAAIATKLAVEEFISQSGKIADEELKKVLDDLGALEELLIASLTAVAERTSSQSTNVLRDVAAHLKRSGTKTGEQTKELIGALKHLAMTQGKQNIDAIAKTSGKIKSSIAEIASGVLAGMADAIHKRK